MKTKREGRVLNVKYFLSQMIREIFFWFCIRFLVFIHPFIFLIVYPVRVCRGTEAYPNFHMKGYIQYTDRSPDLP